jgi:DNA invertase Pin-like site-specific DNA recombinase
VDNDTSAYWGKPRPAWGHLIDDVKARRVDAIVGWHVDRLTRSPRELENVIDLADQHRLKLATCTGDVDLGTPTGRMVARILGATARQESEHKAERQKRQRVQAAAAGKPNGGGERAYGYERDGVTVVPAEAEVIREAARRVLAGESISSISRDFTQRGIKTSAGCNWQPGSLRRLLGSARISGRREHIPSTGKRETRPLVGEIVGDAIWPAIIPTADSDRLRGLLGDPARRMRTKSTGRKYLLSGILRCSKCGGGLCGSPHNGKASYSCPTVPGGLTCGGTSTVGWRTDEWVRDIVLVALASPDLAERLQQRDDVDPELPASIRADEQQLAELAEMYALKEITRSEWQTARDLIEARLDGNRAKLARVSTTAPVDGLSGDYDDLLVRWGAMNLSQRRAVVGAVLDHVDVMPANPGRKWDPDRFRPVWRA